MKLSNFEIEVALRVGWCSHAEQYSTYFKGAWGFFVRLPLAFVIN